MNKVLLSLMLLVATSTMLTAQEAKPIVKRPVYFDVSPPLRDMFMKESMDVDVSWKDGVVKNFFNIKKQEETPFLDYVDQHLQNQFGTFVTDTTLQNFEGLNGGAYIPPDTDGDIGHEYYFQVVNCSYAIYNKNGVKVFGPFPNSAVWSGMPFNANSGDAVVLFDENANRWLFTQFSLPSFPYGPFYQMIAVSQTPDPTGSWYRYQYYFSAMPDYPKFGVWPDAYYMSCNNFAAGSTGYVGTGVAAFDRDAMLNGNATAEMVYFPISSSNEAFSFLPADCDGEFPPLGTPNYFTYIHGGGSPHLGIMEFHVDWETPSASTFTNLLSLPVTSFNSGFSSGIPQLGTSAQLSTLSDRLMFRQQFRKFNDHWSMVLNHTVNAGSNRAGVRWYELRKTTGAWNVYQQATYAPNDGKSRWMASIAMDSAGSIALGYSASSTDMHPAIYYTGRLKSDPLNTMTVAEKSIINGGGSQTSSTSRWGDYSSLRVDPTFPTTFWYTTEYYGTTSSSNWQTRIASFSFFDVFQAYGSAGPELICNGDSIQLNAFVTGGSGNYTFLWSSNPAGFSSTLKNPKAAPQVNTKYMVIISDGSHTVYDTTATIEVKQHPTVFAGNDTIVCSYQPSMDVHGQGSEYRTFGWGTTGDGHFTDYTAMNTTYIFGPEDYMNDSVDLVLVAVPYPPCYGNVRSFKKVKLDPCTGIEEQMNQALNIAIQPNPAHDYIDVTISNLSTSEATLTITNMQGQKLVTNLVEGPSKISNKKIMLNGLPKGIYVLQLTTKLEQKSLRFVIE